jgi:hypothetical protein
MATHLLLTLSLWSDFAQKSAGILTVGEAGNVPLTFWSVTRNQASLAVRLAVSPTFWSVKSAMETRQAWRYELSCDRLKPMPQMLFVDRYQASLAVLPGLALSAA